MKSKFFCAGLALAALLAVASGLDAQCCGGDKKAAGGAAVQPISRKVTSGGTLSTGALAALLRAHARIILIDVRADPQEMIPGAKRLTEESLRSRQALARTCGDKDGLLVTYGDGPQGSASRKMAARLRAAGYPNVVEYREGYAGWKRLKALCGKSAARGPGGTCPLTGGGGGACGTCPSAKGTVARALPAIVDTGGLRALKQARVPVVLLDARYGKWDDGNRIPGAVALKCKDCVSKPETVRKLVKSKDQLIVTYCGGGQCPLGSMLAKKLRALGYTNVIEYKEGLASWIRAGFKTVKQSASCCSTLGGAAGGDKGDCGGTCGGSCGGSCDKKRGARKPGRDGGGG